MGEIYRSVSVTGVRRLDGTQASTPVAKKERVPAEKVKDARAEEPRPASADREPAPVTDSSTAEISKKPSGTGEFERLRDLSVIQEQRIVQLEEEREELLQDCTELADKAVALEQQLQSRTDEEKKSAYEAGLLQAQEELKATEQTIANEVQKMRRLFEENLQAHLQQVDELALEIAFASLTRIVGEQFGDPAFTRAVVTKALRGVRDAQKMTVHLSASDLSIMERHAETSQDGAILSDIDYVADPRVTVGGCLIETDAGVWDARLETQLQRLRDAIAQSIKEGAQDA